MPTTTDVVPSSSCTTAGDDSISTCLPLPTVQRCSAGTARESTHTLFTRWPLLASSAYNVAPPPNTTILFPGTSTTAADDTMRPNPIGDVSPTTNGWSQSSAPVSASNE